MAGFALERQSRCVTIAGHSRHARSADLCDEHPWRSFDEVLILGTICAWVLDPGAGFCSGDSLRCACRLCRVFTAACFATSSIVIRPATPSRRNRYPKTKQAGWPAPMMITPGRLTQMGTQSLTIRPAAVDLEAEAEE